MDTSNSPDNIPEALWNKYFSGTANPVEKRQIQQWISNPANTEQYYTALHKWESDNLQFSVDLKAAEQRIFHAEAYAADGGEKGEYTSSPFFKRHWWKMTAVAASLTALFFLWKKDPGEMITYSTAKGEVRSIALPDKSTVLLNENSTLVVPGDFAGHGSRSVFLNGNACFQVKHTVDSKKFIVNTSHHCRIEVLGTEFDVFSTADSSRIYLKSGSIRLYSKNKHTPILMKPDDIVNIGSNRNVRVLPKQNYWQYKAWENHHFVFNATTLDDIAKMLEGQFDMKISIAEPSLGKRAISGTYQWEEASDILYILSDILSFDIERSDNHYVLNLKNQ